MLAQEAIRAIENVSYRPGWTLTALDVTWFTGRPGIMLAVNYQPPDTDVKYAPDYKVTIDVAPEFYINLADLFTDDDLHREVFRVLIAVELHEAREFFGIRDHNHPEGYFKPVHPHTQHGKAEWDLHYNPNFRNNRAEDPVYF